MTRIPTLLILAVALVAAAPSAGAPAAPAAVVLAEIYGGGGNSGAPYTHDFVELLNVSTAPVSLNGWSIQYASAAGTSWSVTALPNLSLSPGQHFLVQEASGGPAGSALPPPDATGTIAMAATAGKVALVASTTPLTGGCPSGALDLAGYGSSASCFEGSGPAPAASNTTSVGRIDAGRRDTDDNAADFAAGPPDPQNTSVVTAVVVRRFQAKAVGSGVRLAWTSADETGVVAYNVFRDRGGSRVRLNRLPIGARGGAGHTYVFLAPVAAPGARYGLQSVGLDGGRTWIGWTQRR